MCKLGDPTLVRRKNERRVNGIIIFVLVTSLYKYISTVRQAHFFISVLFVFAE